MPATLAANKPLPEAGPTVMPPVVPMLIDEEYPNAKKVILVLDNLNTHHLGSLYETFQDEEAHRIA